MSPSSSSSSSAAAAAALVQFSATASLVARGEAEQISIVDVCEHVRGLRNALAGNARGVELALERGTFGTLVAVLRDIARVVDGAWGGTSEDYARGMMFVLQTIINAGMDDPRCLTNAWEFDGTLHALEAVAQSRGSRAARSHSLMCLFVDMCVKHDVTRINRLTDCDASSFWRLLFVASADVTEPDGVGGGAKLLDLVCTVCCKNDGLPKIFRGLSPNATEIAAMNEAMLRARLVALAEDDSHINEVNDSPAPKTSTRLEYVPEQATLLHFIATVMDDKVATSYVDIHHSKVVPNEQPPLLMPEGVLAFLVDTTSLAAARFASAEDDNERDNAVCILMECVSILRAISEREVKPHAGDTIACLAAMGLVRLVLSLLASLPPPEGIGQTSNATGPASAPKLEALIPKELISEVVYPSKVPWAGYRVDLIAILGNACFNRERVCEDIALLGGVPIVLNHTRGQDDEPYLREWSLWTVRNMTNGSDEARKKIIELQPQAVEQSDELLARGLGVELNSETQKPRVVRQEGSQSSARDLPPIMRAKDSRDVDDAVAEEEKEEEEAIPSNWKVTEL